MLVLTQVSSTLVITDSSISDSSGMTIDLDDNWINIDNATFDNNLSIGGMVVTSTNITTWDSGVGGGTTNYSNLTNKPTNFSDDDLGDNDTDDLTEGATNLYSTLVNIRSNVVGNWLNMSNASFLNNVSIGGKVVTASNITTWDTTSSGNPFDQDLNTTDAPAFPNATFANNISIGGKVIDSSNITTWDAFVAGGSDGYAYDGKIHNSNGNNWSATGANIQQAIWDLNGTGGTVWIPSGTYTNIDLTIDKDNVSLIGQGCGSYMPEGATVFKKTTDGNMLTIQKSGSHNVRMAHIEGIQFQMDDGDTYSGHAIYIKEATDPIIYSCAFENINGSAIFIDDSVYASTIEECKFRRCGNTTNEYSTITYNASAGNQDTYPRVIGCIFEQGIFRDISIENVANVNDGVIRDNYFEAANASGVSRPYHSFIFLRGYRFTVSSNKFFCADDPSIDLTHIYVATSYNIINDNLIRYGKVGIKITAGQKSSIESNNIYGCSYNGIIVQTDKNTICNNVVMSCGTTPATAQCGIKLELSDYNMVDDNAVHACIDKGIYVYRSNNSTISNNIVTNTDYGIGFYHSYDNIVSYNQLSNISIESLHWYDAALFGDLNNSIIGNIGDMRTSLFNIPTISPLVQIAGSIWFNTTSNRFEVYNGTNWAIINGTSVSGGNPFNQDLNTTDGPTFNTLGTDVYYAGNVSYADYIAGDLDQRLDVYAWDTLTLNRQAYGNITCFNGSSYDGSDNRIFSIYGGDGVEVNSLNLSYDFFGGNISTSCTNVTLYPYSRLARIFNILKLVPTAFPGGLSPEKGMLWACNDNDSFMYYTADGWVDLTTGVGDGYAYNGTIQNSNGNSFTVTNAGLQDAIDDLDNESGFVALPICDITITTTIQIGTGCELYGHGNGSVLRLGDEANTTVIKNYDQVNGNDYIKIHDIKIEGNCEGQDVYFAISPPTGDPFYAYTDGIWLKNCKYCEIYSMLINSTQDCGILTDACKWMNTHDCIILNSGISFDGSGLHHYSAAGVFYMNTTDSVMSNVIVDNAYSYGIIVEGYYGVFEKWFSKNVSVSNCIVTNTGGCFYVEDAKNVIFDGCIADCNMDDTCLGANTSKGFYILNGATNGIKHITISDCIIRNAAQGILLSGSYNVITGNQINNSKYNATNSYVNSANHSIISDNVINDAGKYGILDGGHNNTIKNNYIGHTGAADAAIRISSTEDCSVIGNHIVDAQIGVYGANSDTNSIVLFNKILDCGLPIFQVTGRVNCTGYDDWNFYSGVS